MLLVALDPSWLPRSLHTPFHFIAAIVVGLVGAFGAVFAGIGLVIMVKRLITMPPGLTLTAEGFTDHATAQALGLVRWSDIVAISETAMHGTRFLVLRARDPEKYIARGNAFQRKMKRASMAMVGSPVTLASVPLSVSFDEMAQTVAAYHQRYGAGPGVATPA